MLTLLLCAGLIVYRMWNMNRETSSFTRQLRWNGTERLRAINRIFIESALLYTLSIAVSVLMEIIYNNAFYATTGVVSFFILSLLPLADAPAERRDCRYRIRPHHHTHLGRDSSLEPTKRNLPGD